MLMNLAFVYDLSMIYVPNSSLVYLLSLFRVYFSQAENVYFPVIRFISFFFFCSLWSLSHSKAGLAHA